MTNDYILDQMLNELVDKRNKLANTIVVCHNEGYNFDSVKANLFYLTNIVIDCYKITPQLTNVQQAKLINITRKLLAF